MRAVKIHDCSRICRPIFEQVDWAGVLFFTWLAVVISGIFDRSEGDGCVARRWMENGDSNFESAGRRY